MSELEPDFKPSATTPVFLVTLDLADLRPGAVVAEVYIVARPEGVVTWSAERALRTTLERFAADVAIAPDEVRVWALTPIRLEERRDVEIVGLDESKDR